MKSKSNVICECGTTTIYNGYSPSKEIYFQCPDCKKTWIEDSEMNVRRAQRKDFALGKWFPPEPKHDPEFSPIPKETMEAYEDEARARGNFFEGDVGWIETKKIIGIDFYDFVMDEYAFEIMKGYLEELPDNILKKLGYDAE